MISTTIRCANCGRVMEAGEAITATPCDGSPPFHLHRPNAASTCLRWAGRRTDCTIALSDVAAAREWDHDHGGTLAHALRDGDAPRPWIPRGDQWKEIDDD